VSDALALTGVPDTIAEAGRAPLLVLVDGDSPCRFAGYVTELLHVVRGRALRSAMLDGQVVPAGGRTLEGRPPVLLPADNGAGQRRRWQIVWAPAGER
jgi:hypothetical protein